MLVSGLFFHFEFNLTSITMDFFRCESKKSLPIEAAYVKKKQNKNINDTTNNNVFWRTLD